MNRCMVYIFLLLTHGYSGLRSQDIVIPWSSFSFGGGFSSGDNSASTGLAGQAFVGWTQNGPTRIGSGFLAGLSAQSGLTSVEEEMALPITFELYQNYPNPFNPSTTIAYDLPSMSRVTVRIYNLLGQVVSTLVDDHQPAGRYKFVWDAGSQVSSGVYFYRIHARAESGQKTEFVQVRKLVLLK